MEGADMTLRARRAILPLLILATAAFFGAPGLAAQEDHSVYSLLNTAGRTVAVGASVEGALTGDDPLAGDGHRIQVWALQAAPGQDVRVDLRGADFDPYLQVVGPGMGRGFSDDDGGFGLNARLCFTVPEGETRIVASSLDGSVGGFFLDVTESSDDCSADDASGAVDPMLLPTDGRRLSVGDETEGFLSYADARGMSSPTQAWLLGGQAGEPVSVDLRSLDFDAYLLVAGPGLDALTDDDGAGRCDSRITFTFPETGEYRVVVGTLGEGTGAFLLSAMESERSVDPDPCIPPSTDSEPDPGVLGEIPVQGSIAIDSAEEGELTGSEIAFRGSPLQAWALEGSAGDRLAILSTSETMDGYLFFTGPGFQQPLQDDDSGGDFNPLICVELPEDGTYTVFPGRLGTEGPGTRYRLEVMSLNADDYCDEYQLSEERLTETLLALDTGGRTLELDREASGAFGPDEVRHPSDGSPIQAWALTAEPGTTVWIDEISNDFDPLLRVLDASGNETTSDDYEEGWNSRVEVTVPDDGRLVVLAGAFYIDSQGSFTLRVSLDPPPLEVNVGGGGGEASVSARVDPALLAPAIETPLGEVAVGTELRGTLDETDTLLDDGNWAQSWTFRGEAGDQVVLVLTSDDFDSVLYLAGPGLGDPLSNDDGGPALGSRLQVRLSEGGTFTVVVSALSEGTGSYQLMMLRPAGE